MLSIHMPQITLVILLMLLTYISNWRLIMQTHYIIKTMTLHLRKKQCVWSIINYASLCLVWVAAGRGAPRGPPRPAPQFAPFSRRHTTLGYLLLGTVYGTHLTFHRTNVTCFFRISIVSRDDVKWFWWFVAIVDRGPSDAGSSGTYFVMIHCLVD